MKLLNALREFLVNLAVANAFCKTSLPGLVRFAGIVVDDKGFVGLVCTGLEATTELQATDLLEVLETRQLSSVM